MNPLPLIDPGVVTLVQTTFLENINNAFSVISQHAFNLLYLFATIEVVVLGLAWALQREIGWDKLFFKVIKIGLIFFLIQNYPWIIDTILQSFARLAGAVVNDASAADFIFNPAQIWQYGYDSGVNLLKLATDSNIFGLAMVQVSLGMGILLAFGILGIQMVVQMVSFYLVSFAALIMLPFGALSPSRNMLDNALLSVLKAGVRLMTLIIIIGIAVYVWNGFNLIDLETTGDFNLNQPLGLFFTSLLFLCMSFYLPNIVSQTVGTISSNLSEGGQSVVAVSQPGTATMSHTDSGSTSSNMQAATIVSGSTSGSSSSSSEVISSAASAATVPNVTVTASSMGKGIETKASKADLANASSLSRKISENTVKNIKEAIASSMKEEK